MASVSTTSPFRSRHHIAAVRQLASATTLRAVVRLSVLSRVSLLRFSPWSTVVASSGRVAVLTLLCALPLRQRAVHTGARRSPPALLLFSAISLQAVSIL